MSKSMVFFLFFSFDKSKVIDTYIDKILPTFSPIFRVVGYETASRMSVIVRPMKNRCLIALPNHTTSTFISRTILTSLSANNIYDTFSWENKVSKMKQLGKWPALREINSIYTRIINRMVTKITIRRKYFNIFFSTYTLYYLI